MGLKPYAGVDIDAMVEHICDAENYPHNVQYVESTEVVERRSDTDVTYVQRMNLPVIGRVQVQINLADYGERDGWRIVAWDQDDDGTDDLDKKNGARTQYNLGAWLLREDGVAYALSSAPRKSDMNALKYMAMTKGAISKLADRLLEKSLIERRANANDKRAHTLILNQEGRALVPRLAALADENDQEFFGALTTDEHRRLSQLLRQIVKERELTNIPVD